MSLADRTYDRLAGGTSTAGSVAARMRERRWHQLVEKFPDLSSMRVLDLGGTSDGWLMCPERPAHVTLLNIFPTPDDLPPEFTHVEGDACRPPRSVTDQTWDLVYSNSVIEHIGGHARRVEFSAVTRALAPAYWVQTPYRYFPIEPHWLFPGFQFLPVAARTTVAMKWPVYKWRSDDRDRALREVLEIELLSLTEFASLFPDATLVRERWAGLTKSLIAMRTSAQDADRSDQSTDNG